MGRFGGLIVNFQVFSQQQSRSTTSQSIKDFFIPTQMTEIAKASYQGTINMNIYYKYTGGQKYEIMHEKSMSGKIVSHKLMYINISKDEVLMSKEILSNIIHAEKIENYNPAKILLRLPEVNKPASWSFLSLPDEVEKSTAVLTTVAYKGKRHKAIKVTTKNSESYILEIAYYLKGIGLYKVVFFDPKTNEETLVHEFVQMQAF